MKIYEYLTIKFTNFKETETVLKKYKNLEINILWTNQYLSLQGPHVMNAFKVLGRKKQVNLIAEVGKNIGLALTVIELEVKKMSISNNLDKDLTEKIKSLAKKKGIQVLITEKFKKIKNINDLI
ncbi:MAG: hypothetical protein CL572_06190 [Alphaproteobacteria bacterium]|nr:hypothetical protein [Alphaproteobacteria bacterium]|tara:strand:- start:159 stop:530 length:372 start_codon:yes stop_codon:yes gene_type:complete